MKEQVTAWESRYGEVVWVKFERYNWWPSFILDPLEVKDEKYRNQALCKINKVYIIYFYGDYRYAFVAQSSIRPFNQKTRETLKSQVIPKYYEGSFYRALAEADAEFLRPKGERLSWYFNGEEDMGQAVGKETGQSHAAHELIAYNEDQEVVNFGNFDFLPVSSESLCSSAFLHSKDILLNNNRYHQLLEPSSISTPSSSSIQKGKKGKIRNSWESRYHEVVWVRLEQYPWWPACILNPLDVERKLQKQAINKTNKEYTIYFYGDYRYAFVPISSIQPYSEQTRKSFKNQVIPKYYEGSFYRALAEADAEVLLTKEERLSWYFNDLDEPLTISNMKQEADFLKEGKSSEKNKEEADIADLENIELFPGIAFGSETNYSPISSSNGVVSKKRGHSFSSFSSSSQEVTEESSCSVVSPSKKAKITHQLVKVRPGCYSIFSLVYHYSFRGSLRMAASVLPPL
jgi:hypothetical protein